MIGVARGLGGACDGDHVVHAHDQVGNDDGFDRAPELVAALDIAVVVIGIGGQQFHTNPDEQKRAHKFEERNRQQCERKKDQDDPQDDGTCCAPQDALSALVLGQLTASQGDHDGVVAAQQDVDHDDLGDSNPERSGQKFFHGGPFARWSGRLYAKK